MLIMPPDLINVVVVVVVIVVATDDTRAAAMPYALILQEYAIGEERRPFPMTPSRELTFEVNVVASLF